MSIHSFLHKFYKQFRNTRQDIGWSVVFFLKTGVIFASFTLSGKLAVIKHSLKRFC